jgi:hypothetical protein
MMLTRSVPVCGLTNPSGPERFRSENTSRRLSHGTCGNFEPQHRPAAKLRPGGLEAFDWTRVDPARPQPGRPLEEQLNA